MEITFSRTGSQSDQMGIVSPQDRQKSQEEEG